MNGDVAFGAAPPGGYPVTVHPDGVQKSSPELVVTEATPEPSCEVHASAGQDLLPNVETILTLDVVDRDALGNYSISSNFFLAPKDGWYDVWGQVSGNLANVGDKVVLHIQVDQVVVETLVNYVASVQSPGGDLSGSNPIYLNAGQTICLSAQLGAISTLTLTGNQMRMRVVYLHA